MNEVKCAWFSNGNCLKGLPGTKCEVKGCVAKTEVVPCLIQEIIKKENKK